MTFGEKYLPVTAVRPLTLGMGALTRKLSTRRSAYAAVKKTIPILAGFIVMPLSSAPAFAEMPTYAYVGVACSRNDKGGSDAVILFTDKLQTTQDADTHHYATHPVFPILPQKVDHGLSGGTVSLASEKNDDTSCGVRPNELLVRHGAQLGSDEVGGKPYQEWISTWIGNRKILSRFMIRNEDDASGTIIDAVTIIEGKVGVCAHSEKSGVACKPIGDAVNMGTVQFSYDFRAIAPGRIAAMLAVDGKLCAGLVHQGRQDDDINLPLVIRPDRHGEADNIAPDDQDYLGFDSDSVRSTPYRSSGIYAHFTEIAVYDLSNSGAPYLVVNAVGETHAFTGNYLVAIPLGQNSKDDIELVARNLDDDKVALPKDKGWLTFGGEETPYKNAYTNLDPGRVDGITYLLASSNSSNPPDTPIAFLLKPMPDGTMIKMCEYHRGQPVF